MGQQKHLWVKIRCDFFFDKKMKKLRSLESGDTYTIIYLKMQLKALKTNGELYFDEIENTFAEEIALDIDENPDDVKKALEVLMQLNLIEELIPNKVFKINKIANDTRDRCTAEYKNWREAVFERDNYICQSCGKTGNMLNAHHIKSWKLFPRLRFDISNGITLCEKCHKNYHKKYGLGESKNLWGRKKEDG